MVCVFGLFSQVRSLVTMVMVISKPVGNDGEAQPSLAADYMI